VVGDFSAGQGAQDVAALVSRLHPDFVLTVGDNNYPDGSAATIDSNVGRYYHSFIAPYKGSYGAGSADGHNHFWPSLGDHDWDTSAAAWTALCYALAETDALLPRAEPPPAK